MTTSFAQATRLVAQREMKAFLQTKGFWIGLGITVLALAALILLPTWLAGDDRPEVVAVGPQAAQVLAGSDLDVREAGDVSAAEALVEAEEVQAAVVPDDSGQSVTGVRVVALDEVPTDVLARLNTAPPVDLLAPSEVSQGVRDLVIMVFALVFMIFGFGGVAIAQSTVTEKQTRIVEILVAAVPVRALLAGKIVGHALLTIGQLAVVAAVGLIALRIGGHMALLDLVAPALGWFVPFVCVGFVLLAAGWAVAGSLVSRQEDLGSTMGLMVMLVMGPYFAVLFLSDNATAMTVLSFVPFSAAIAMPVRLFAGEAHSWEALLSLGLLATTVVLVILLASRIYSGSLLRTGARVRLSDAWTGTG